MFTTSDVNYKKIMAKKQGACPTILVPIDSTLFAFSAFLHAAIPKWFPVVLLSITL